VRFHDTEQQVGVERFGYHAASRLGVEERYEIRAVLYPLVPQPVPRLRAEDRALRPDVLLVLAEAGYHFRFEENVNAQSMRSAP